MIRIPYFLIILILTSCQCQQNTIEKNQKTFQSTINENIKIYESDGYSIGPCEPSIYINPSNTQNIVAGSVINYFHYSFDGGKTWETDILKSSMGVWGDPCIVADTKGNFYYFHLSDPDGANWRSEKILDRMVVQCSEDGGKTWNDGSHFGKNSPKQQDKEWAGIHPKTNEIYTTWTEFDKYNSSNPDHKTRILISSSADKGNTWSDPVAINEFDGNAKDDDKTVEGAVPAIDNEGNIYVAWSYNDKIYFDTSSDNGVTWREKDIVISDQPGGWTFDIPGLDRCNGMPVTCVDISNGEHSGTIYVNWSDQRNGKDNTDIFISKSTDKGNTWSLPKKVNEDNTSTHQFLTWMSVDPKTGYIYIVYYDRSRYKDNQTDVVLSVSYDGGENFISKTISEKPFTPVSSIFFGDYNNIHAYNRVIRPVWTRYDNGKLSIWTAIIDDNANQ
ncbi:sialidase family protein [Abyssalbus ytuae]|uniref:Glycoside hydrolase n=1 Tax=Abyssalbus ytuae TaxID=2926907 RepID=A0A9E6ZP83_9FLAO|nr:sialidase family protein [Abyssalbus ytuae]UOB18349.1 glycoside hydrolase [Abyssalbus ytuae]